MNIELIPVAPGEGMESTLRFLRRVLNGDDAPTGGA